MRKWQFNIRKLLVWVVLIAALLGAALFVLRRGFDPGDVSVELQAPKFVNVGEEAQMVLLIKNGSGSPLRDVRATLFLPDGTSIQPSFTERVENIEAKQQRTVEFHVPIVAGARDFTVRASIRFRAGTLSATFEKTAEASVLVAAAPVEISFSFPSDISAERPFTFFIKYKSDAAAALEGVGVTLEAPANFTFIRARPAQNNDGPPLIWDIGALLPGAENEISVTGKFAAGDAAGEFVARIGLLSDNGRDLRVVFHEARERRTAITEDLSILLYVQQVENPGEVIIMPGEKIDVRVAYENKSTRTLEDVIIDLGIAHRDLEQRSITATPLFRRLPSGEYRWDASSVPSFAALLPGSSGEILFSVALSNSITMNGIQDANQSFSIQVRAFAEGRLQAERSARAKIGAHLSVREDVFYKDSTYVNTGPMPPRAGQTTTFTVRVLVVGGTNGFRNTVMRFVLGDAVVFGELLSPQNAAVAWDESSRELVWNLGIVTAGTGILQPPRELVFRINATPRQDQTGSPMVLIESTKISGEDDFTGRLEESEFGAYYSDGLSDPGFQKRDGIVQQ